MLFEPESTTQPVNRCRRIFSSVGVTATTDVAAVPEPASIGLLGAGLFGMGFLRRRGGEANRTEFNQVG
jgi:hypothetical protein